MLRFLFRNTLNDIKNNPQEKKIIINMCVAFRLEYIRSSPLVLRNNRLSVNQHQKLGTPNLEDSTTTVDINKGFEEIRGHINIK